MEMVQSTRIYPKSPGELLRDFISEYLKENCLSEVYLEEVPKKWEKYGDLIMFNHRAFQNELWQNQSESFWMNVCMILKCKRIGIKNKIQSDCYRTPNAKMLYGVDPWVACTDNSIKYSWNIESNMFSAGNAPERHRIAQLNCEGEIVVDLFAGIGYFTLPFLVHGKAAFVHACEWNPNALIALKQNLMLNKVQDKCTVYEGDNRLVCPKKIANRVNLGLLPSSELSWKVACGALNPNGGILHVHGNVETKKNEINCRLCQTLLPANDRLPSKKTIAMKFHTESFAFEETTAVVWKHHQWLVWGVHVLHSMMSNMLENSSSKEWICSIENLHFVKSYAPHVDHLVLDVQVKKC